MNEYWFKPKTHGYGATPVTWEGWVLLVAYLVFILVTSLALLGPQPSLARWIVWAGIVIAVTITMTWFTRRKTKGEWRWRWGRESLGK